MKLESIQVLLDASSIESEIKDSKKQADNAAQTASNYISASSSGIRIASANPATQNQRLELTNSKATFYDSGNTQRLALDSSNGVVVGNPSKGRAVINDAGMTVYDTNNKKRTAVDSNGLHAYDTDGSTEVAVFGATARIGKPSSSRFHMNADSLQAYNSSNEKYFEVSASGLKYGNDLAKTVETTSGAQTKADAAKNSAISTAAADATTKADAAAKTATSFIMSFDSDTGITLKPSDSRGNDYLQMSSTDIRFVRNNVDVMNLSDSVFRIGQASSGHAKVESDGLRVFDSDGSTEVAFFGASAKIGDVSQYNTEISPSEFSIKDVEDSVFRVSATENTRPVDTTATAFQLTATSNKTNRTAKTALKRGTSYTFTLQGSGTNASASLTYTYPTAATSAVTKTLSSGDNKVTIAFPALPASASSSGSGSDSGNSGPPVVTPTITQITTGAKLNTFKITYPNKKDIQVAGIHFTGNNNPLWSGAWYMNASQTANLSELVSEQLTGIVLVWSAYSDEAKDYDWHYQFVPKMHPILHSGQGMDCFLTTSNFTYIGGKYVYIYDNKIVGHDNNVLTGTKNGVTFNNKHWVLRYVYGV